VSDDDELLDEDDVLDDVPPVVAFAEPLELSVPPDKMISAIVTLPVSPELPLLPGPPENPPGGGPPAPPAPPGPFARALAKRFCNSLAWLLVSEPF